MKAEFPIQKWNLMSDWLNIIRMMIVAEIYFPPSQYGTSTCPTYVWTTEKRNIGLWCEHGNTVTYCFFNFFREFNKYDLEIDKTSLAFRLLAMI